MPIADRIGAMGNVIKAAAAVVATLPGVAILTGLIPIPKELTTVVTFICAFVGIACILSVVLLSQAISRAKPARFVAAVLILAVVGSTTSASYYLFAKRLVVVIEDGESGKSSAHIIPLSPSKKLVQLLGPYPDDYREALETSGQRFRLMDYMNRENASAVALLILLLVLSQALLVSAIAVAAWRIAEADRPGIASG